MRTSSNYALRLPASLKRAAEEVAREDGTTLNQFIVSAVAEKLVILKTADYFAKRAARADFAGFDRLMRRRGGEASRPDDELHAPGARRMRARTKKAAKASELAAQEIDRLIDPSAAKQERQRRKGRLLKGPREFRDIRGRR